MKITTALVMCALVMLAACAPAPPVPVDPVSSLPGFWSGLWHGIILPFSWIGSLFSDNIGIYAVKNNGGWYDFGFVLGAGALLGGGSSAAR